MKLFHGFAAAALAVSCADFVFAQELIEFIEVHRTIPGETIDFVFVDDLGGVTRQSISDGDLDGFITAQVPSGAKGKYVHTPSCFYVKLENAIVSSLTGGSATIPLLVDNALDGLTIVPAFSVDDLDMVPTLAVNDLFSVTVGASSEYSFGTIYAPPVGFPALTDPDFAAFDSYPGFTGTARVAELLSVRVYVVPEPTSLGFAAATGVILILACRHKKKR